MQWVKAIQTMFEEKVGGQMRSLKGIHEVIAGNLQEVHKDARSRKHQKEIMDLYGQKLEEIKDTAEAHARRMAGTLRAMYADRIVAEKRRTEIETRKGDHKPDMIYLGNIIDAQKKRNIEPLEEFSLTLLPGHP